MLIDKGQPPNISRLFQVPAQLLIPRPPIKHQFILAEHEVLLEEEGSLLEVMLLEHVLDPSQAVDRSPGPLQEGDRFVNLVLAAQQLGSLRQPFYLQPQPAFLLALEKDIGPAQHLVDQHVLVILLQFSSLILLLIFRDC
jgi:hypothetical protein